jgi:hypothetical protein
MTDEAIERVFGRGRQKMATGDHVEVYREALVPGHRRRYTKRFVATDGADFRQWTDREWRILARMIGHGVRCVPAVVQYHGGAEGGLRELQTYDAGVSVDQWATLLPVERDGARFRHAFEDAAHWWALAHHTLAALDEIHALALVHLDVKADNLCVPYAPSEFDPGDAEARLTLDFSRLALIDFAFSLVSGERLLTSLPIGWQKDYDYQSPRLLRALDAGRDGDLAPTQELDWRCDFYSLAAMLRRYLPDDVAAPDADGWTESRRDDARALILRLRDCHDGEDASQRPHRELMTVTAAHLADPALARSLEAGWSLVRDPAFVATGAWATPLTRIAALPLPPTRLTRVRSTVIAPSRDEPRVFRNPRAVVAQPEPPVVVALTPARVSTTHVPPGRRLAAASVAAAVIVVAIAAPFVVDAADPLVDAVRRGLAQIRSDDAVAPGASAEAPSVAAVAAPALPQRAEAPPANALDTTPTQRAEEPPAKTVDTTPTQRKRDADTAMRPPSAPGTVANHGPLPDRSNARIATRSAPVPSERRAKPASTRTAAQPTDPVMALLASPGAEKAPAPFDPVAARLATARLTQEAVRVAPPQPAQSAPAALSEPPAPPARADTLAPNVASAAQAVAGAPVEPILAPAETTLEPPRPQESAPARASGPPPPSSPTRERWTDRLQSALGKLGLVPQRAAPVEERGPSLPAAPPPRPDVASVPPDRIIAAPPRSTPRAPYAWSDPDSDLAARGRRIVSDNVPVVAAQASIDVAAPLRLATTFGSPLPPRMMADTTNARWRSESIPTPAAADAMRARDLYEAARAAFEAGRRDEAVELQYRALAANPRDPDLAGFLAFLHLYTSPVRAETARTLALQALAFSGTRRGARFEDWNTFAVASALTGRQADASRAYLLMLGLTGDAQRSCHAALRAQATFGDALRPPVEALAIRLRRDGRANEAPACLSASAG